MSKSKTKKAPRRWRKAGVGSPPPLSMIDHPVFSSTRNKISRDDLKLTVPLEVDADGPFAKMTQEEIKNIAERGFHLERHQRHRDALATADGELPKFGSKEEEEAYLHRFDDEIRDHKKAIADLLDRRPVVRRNKTLPEKMAKMHVLDTLEQLGEMSPVYRKMFARVQELRPVARRFIFDAEASKYIGEFIRDCPDLLLENRQFALPPYETTYIQVDIDAALGAIGKPTTGAAKGDWTRDVETGYVIHRKTVYALARAVGSLGGLGLFRYEMDAAPRPGTIFDISVLDSDPSDDYVRQALLLGSTYGDLTEEQVKDFCHDVRIDLNVEFTSIHPTWTPDRRRDKYSEMIASSAGDYRIMLTALLLLNQKHHVTTEFVPHSSMLIGGKRRVFQKHNRVVLHLKAHETVRKVFGGTLGKPRRAHDVRAFFRHIGPNRTPFNNDCGHEWSYLPEILNDGIERWTCSKCKGKRIRVKEHVRGHGGEGVVTKRYEVKE